MKRSLLVCLIFLASIISADAQSYFDSLQGGLLYAKEDTNKVLLLCGLAEYHQYIQTDSNTYYANKAIELSQKIHYDYGRYLATESVLFKEIFRANYSKAMEIALDNLQIAESLKTDRLYVMALAHLNISKVSLLMEDPKRSSEEFALALAFQKKSGKMDGEWWPAFSFKRAAILKSQPDSALIYALKSFELAKQSVSQKSTVCLATAILGDTYQECKKFSLARYYYELSLQQSVTYGNVYIRSRVYRNIAELFKKQGNLDSSLYFAQLALDLSRQYNFGDYLSQASQLMANLYESQHKSDSSLKYMKVMLASKESIFSPSIIHQYQLSLFDAEQKHREALATAEKYRNTVRLYSLISIAAVFLTLLLILYRNNRVKQKAYALIRRQKQETDTQKARVEKAYQELKSTQAQLIQSEKMASLGELTAGIAHEIQNPLNFVNNFSEVNKELIDEASQANEAGNKNEVKALLTNLRENEAKITSHGKRADAIVKGMLQHSQATSGQKEPTDINALADEYMRLSYQGLRAKDRSFIATLQTHFDQTIGKINIHSQEIGRVLLNLYNNAFYAVSEKKRQQPEGYEPAVSVSTKKNGDKIEIRVRDNGNGIPNKALDKIFQPFFTTKPTGQGTGLGLSLSYDIVKAHGGEISVDTREREFTAFVIHLPISPSV